ncbi:MAG: ABC transporter permease [Deltaproteobacteria bacterium]|nr:ABC transporter permease [Deltaproteobacteria bacterium]
MRLAGSLALAGRDLVAARGRATISAAGIGLGVTVLVIIVGLGLGAQDAILKGVVRRLPVDTIEVVPRTVDLGLFSVGTGSLFGAPVLNAETLARLQAMAGVGAAYPKLEVKLPMGARGGARVFGRDLYTDLFMTALPTELVVPEVGPEFADLPGVVPVVVSDQLLEVYNGSVAPALGTPRLGTQTLKGFEFELVFGRSLMLGSRGAKHTGVERGRIVGVSRFAMRFGITVPLETARRLLATYGDADGGAETYASILVAARTPAAVPQITAAVRAMGLAVDETAARTSDILTALTLLASLVGLLVLALAAMNIAHSFFASLSERRRELAVLRAVGARKVDLVLIVLAQAALLGACGGLFGVAAAHLGAAGIDWAATRWLPDFPFKPESFFAIPGWLDAVGVVAAIAAAVLGAGWPAVRAATTSLAKALAEV